MIMVNAVLALFVIMIIARLIELQVARGDEFQERAQALHYGEIQQPARRGEILGLSSKTGEQTIFATNITLDLAYVDPKITDDPVYTANVLADTLLTQHYHDLCTRGDTACPRELIPFYSEAYDPLTQMRIRQSGSILEPIPAGKLPPSLLKLPNLVQARDAFARSIGERISEKYVTFAPLKYGATKVEMSAVKALQVPGVRVDEEQALVYANPQDINQSLLESFSASLGKALHQDPKQVRSVLRSRALRYVPVMRRLPVELSRKLLELKAASAKDALEQWKKEPKKNRAELRYPLEGVALIAEHWRFYPDTTIASHVVGFLNNTQEPQYGVERTFDVSLRGQKGTIRTVSDPHGGQIFRADQDIRDPRDGDTVVLTLDRDIQKFVETEINAALERYKAESAQAIVLEPYTGRILAMVNSPPFDSNNYTIVYEKEPIQIDALHQQQIISEIFHPETNALVARALRQEIFTASGRLALPEKTQKELQDIERLYDLHDLTRYYMKIGENLRREIFPTADPGVWLKFKNNIGLGAYLNRSVQEIYEPGSVLKAITTAIAIDQGEIVPLDTYDDTGPVVFPEDPMRPINNNDFKHYGRVTMTNCLEFSINTCMTDIAARLGAKLFHGMLTRFGFAHITGIELEDELAGELIPWRGIPRRTLGSLSFGQGGISATPLQVVTAVAALANGGKLMKPTIIDSIIRADGTTERHEPTIVDQVITKETSDTITAMLTSSATKGFAKAGKPAGYRIAGKTGTSEIAGPGGKYETGTGSTIATYAGYAPVNHPKFVVLVKLDRPKNSIHGATAAAPVAKEILSFLFRYYDIPPDEK